MQSSFYRSRESAPDATTLLKFRRLLGTHGLTRKIVEAINVHLAEQGLILHEETIVDAQSGRVHTRVTTATNTRDISQTHALLHSHERTVFGDAGYQGIQKRPESQGETVEWLVAMKRSVRNALPADELGRRQDRFETRNASIRGKVERPFHVVKNLFR